MNWTQFKTILWLRRQLTRNQFLRGSTLGRAFAIILPALAVLIGWLAFAGGFAVGWLGLHSASPMVVSLVWLEVTAAFLLFWTFGLLTELQRSETIDLQRLMHLPVLLGQVFVINFVASHFVFSLILFVPGMTGLALGLAVSRGASMLLLIPLTLAMVFMVSAWTYCLRGWLGTLMANPRKRRAIVAGITVVVVMLGQAPNLFNTFFHVANHDHSAPSQTLLMLNKLDAAQAYVPPLWLPVGARALAEHRALPAILGTLGCLAIGAFGLRRAYGVTVRFYRGATDPKASPRPRDSPGPALRPATAKGRGTTLLERGIPGVPDEAAALALATFRSLMRAPEVKMALATSFLMPLILGSTVLFRAPGALPAAATPFIAAAAVVLSVFMTIQFLANQFGYDRAGFRTLVLAPASRRHILLGKNLATLPFSATFGLLLVGVVAIGLRLPWPALCAAAFQLVTAVVLANLGGNLLSITVPYRIQAGSLKPSKQPWNTMLMLVVFQMLFPLVLTPVFIPPLAELLLRWAGLPPAVPVNLILSIALAAGAVLAYWLLLGPLGRLLERRETRIIQSVTTDVE